MDAHRITRKVLGLPQSTEVKRPLPKAQIYKRFDWKPSQRDSFDGEVSRLDFVNWISPRTLPSITEGTEVKEIFVIEVTLKNRDFDIKNIALLGKTIPQRIVYLLRYEDEARIAVYYTRLFLSPWQHAESMSLQLKGLNLDAVWEAIVRDIAQLPPVGTSLCDVLNGVEGSQNQPTEGISLQEQIKANEQRAKIERQIASLERQMNATKQPRRKRELFEQLQKIKKFL